ncbi:hypothetical protein GF354_05340 [Candidatus Peregrinibacteria bacterium]|nr:hypothetical protein [Candidatus Peregrinibacteria bacterium]
MAERSRLRPLPKFEDIRSAFADEEDIPIDVEEPIEAYPQVKKGEILNILAKVLKNELIFFPEVTTSEDLDNPLRLNIDDVHQHIERLIRAAFESDLENTLKSKFATELNEVYPAILALDGHGFFSHLIRFFHNKIDAIYKFQSDRFNASFSELPEDNTTSFKKALRESAEYKLALDNLESLNASNIKHFAQYRLGGLIAKLYDAINACKLIEESLADPELHNSIDEKYAELNKEYLENYNLILRKQTLDTASSNSVQSANQFILDFSNGVICVNHENFERVESDLVDAFRIIEEDIREKVSEDRFLSMQSQLQNNMNEALESLKNKTNKAKRIATNASKSDKFLEYLKDGRIALTPDNLSSINDKVKRAIKYLHQFEINNLGSKLSAENLLALYLKYEREAVSISKLLRKM